MACSLIFNNIEKTPFLLPGVSKISNPKLSNIPIVALTTNQSESHQAKMLAVGMDDFMVKPLKPLKLESILTKLFTKAEF